MDNPISFRQQTRSIVNILQLIVLVFMPVLWAGDYKNLVSLLFKTILPNEPHSVEIIKPLHIPIILLGVLAYLLFRYERRREHRQRYIALKRGNSASKYDQVKIRLLERVNELLTDQQEDEWGLTQQIYRKNERKKELELKVDANIDDSNTDTSSRKDKPSPVPVPKRVHYRSFHKAHSDNETSRRRKV